MRKKGAIITIILSFIIIFILGGILIFSIVNKNSIFNFNGIEFSINSSSDKEVTEQKHSLQDINLIDINLDVGDITIKETENNEIKIIQTTNYNGEDKRELEISTNGNTLKIERKNSKFIDKIGSNKYIDLEIYMPLNYNKDLSINSAVGDIDIETKFDLNKLEINLAVGDIEFKEDVKANDLNISSSVGDIEMQNIDVKNYNINCTLGDKEIKGIVGE